MKKLRCAICYVVVSAKANTVICVLMIISSCNDILETASIWDCSAHDNDY
jgi:hypothetical protein